MRRLPSIAVGLTAIAAVACGSNNAASQIAVTPSAGDAFEAKCTRGAEDLKPLVVAVPSSDKLAMEAHVRSGPLVVRYEGCRIELLSRCRVAGAYHYVGGTVKRDSVAVKNEDDLFAKIPVGAMSLRGKVQTRGTIAVAMATVGRFEIEGDTDPSSMTGDCQGATHWVSAITVGAFRLAAGAEAEVGAEAALFGAGAGGRSAHSHESVSEDGDGTACSKAAETDERPPASCGGLLRFELVPISGGKS